MTERVSKILSPVVKTDVYATRSIFRLINNNKYLKQLPYIFGLLPYEIYVIPGMYLSILQSIWLETVNPIQFHLLPHWFAYSFFQLLKGTIKRGRPGCVNKDMKGEISPNHCNGKVMYQSFPSGHTGVSFALATALYMEMMHSDNPKFFEFPIKTERTRKLIAGIVYFIASSISVHRMSKGYHHLFDVIIGAILGAIIGYLSWTVVNVLKKKYNYFCNKYGAQEKEVCEEHEIDKLNLFQQIKYKIKHKNKNINTIKFISKLILSFIVVSLLTKFFLSDIRKLATIKH